MQVLEALCKRSNLQEILFNFSRFKDKKRVPLRQNPHFYNQLPTSPKAYGSRFQTDPIHDFQDVEQVYVLLDKPGHVYLETPGKKRAFGNSWVPDDAIIFKGSPIVFCLFCHLRPLSDARGKLEGEGIVGEGIESTVDIWYCEEPSPISSLSVDSPTSVTAPHPIDTASPTNFFAGHWRELVLRKRDDYHLRISTKPPENLDDRVRRDEDSMFFDLFVLTPP